MYVTTVHKPEGVPVNEVSVKDARDNLKALIDEVAAGGEVMILRHGRPVARLVPPYPRTNRLPSMAEFRKTIEVRGRPMSEEIIAERDEERLGTTSES